jgi:hypothetical protein
MPDQNASDLFGEIIFAYTRAQAIADGALVDVSNRAKRFAIRFPVALTTALYAAITRDADTDAAKHLCVDLLLITMRRKIAAATGPTDRIDFTVKIPQAPAIDVYALCTPGDTSDPVITVMLPHED